MDFDRGESIKLTVELFGYMRSLARVKRVEMELAPESTLRDAAVALADQYPKLGSVLLLPELPEWIAFYLQDDEGHYRDRKSVV